MRTPDIPAFPIKVASEPKTAPNGLMYRDEVAHPGMTLRDYFAAKAMQGLMGRNWCDPTTGKAPDDIFEVWALSAYKAADAMLATRG